MSFWYVWLVCVKANISIYVIGHINFARDLFFSLRTHAFLQIWKPLVISPLSIDSLISLSSPFNLDIHFSSFPFYTIYLDISLCSLIKYFLLICFPIHQFSLLFCHAYCITHLLLISVTIIFICKLMNILFPMEHISKCFIERLHGYQRHTHDNWVVW